MHLSLKEIADKLQVKYILTHSFLIKDDGFDLWCKLENIETGVALFSNKISEPIDMATQMVGKLANDIVTSLKIKTKQDVMKAPTANIEAYEYYLKAKHKYDKRESEEDIELVKGLLKKSIELDDNLLSAKQLLGWVFYHTGNVDIAKLIFQNNLKQAEKLDDKRSVAEYFGSLATYYADRADYDIALEYVEKSIEIYEEIGDLWGFSGRLNTMGIIYHYKGESNKSLAYWKKTQQIYKQLDIQDGMILGNLGNAYANLGKLDKALDYYTRSLKYYEDKGDKMHSAGRINCIGIVYNQKGNYDKALEYNNRSLKMRKEINDTHGLGYDYFHIGNDYYFKGELNKALNYFNLSYNKFEEINKRRDMYSVLSHIGYVYYDKLNYNKAQEYLEKSLELKKELGLSKKSLLGTTACLYLVNNSLGKENNLKEINDLINASSYIEFQVNLHLYQLLEDTSYLQTAYNQIQEKADNLEPDVAAKFLSYPIPKAIVEEWEKVK